MSAAVCSLWLMVSGRSVAVTLARGPSPPYPASSVIAGIDWDWKTHQTAAPGSDLWPVTVGADRAIYTAWGDGGGFHGTDQRRRVATGFARITGPPEQFTAVNVNGGVDCEHRASFAQHGKVGGLLAVRSNGTF